MGTEPETRSATVVLETKESAEECASTARRGLPALKPSHTRTQVIKGTELPRQTVPRAPGTELPALQVTLAH